MKPKAGARSSLAGHCLAGLEEQALGRDNKRWRVRGGGRDVSPAPARAGQDLWGNRSHFLL